MLLRWDIEHPGQFQLMPAPIPTWDGVEYVDSHALPTFRTGDGVGPTFESGGDLLTITTAEGKQDKGDLRVEGTASQATSVVIHEGTPSGGSCPGTVLGSAPIDNNGGFRFDTTVGTIPSDVCVTCDNGDVATSPVELK